MYIKQTMHKIVIIQSIKTIFIFINSTLRSTSINEACIICETIYFEIFAVAIALVLFSQATTTVVHQ